jgi:hypothetical protein
MFRHGGRRRFIFIVMVSAVVLVGAVGLQAWENQPRGWKVLPEAIWAPAAGSGTWQTELQVSQLGAGTHDVHVYFFYNGGVRGPIVLATLERGESYRYTNILQRLGQLDPGFNYYGRVGAIWIWGTGKYQVAGFTRNGNVGKAFPGLSVVDGHTCAEGRPMVLQSFYNGTVRRSVLGVFNTSGLTYVAKFNISNSSGLSVGGFQKTIPPFGFMAFNPFVEAGIEKGVYTNVTISVHVISGGSATRGLMLFGSVNNNFTNAPAAVMAYPMSEVSTTIPISPEFSGDPLKSNK